MSRQVYQSRGGLHTSFLILLSAVSIGCLAGCSSQKRGLLQAADYAYEQAQSILLCPATTRALCSEAVYLLHTSYARHACARTASLLATTLFSLGHVAQSVVWFFRARQQASTVALYHEITNNYACALSSMGLRRRALQLWGELVQAATYATPERAWYNRGRCFMMMGNRGKARASWGHALRAVRMEQNSCHHWPPPRTLRA